MTLKLGRSPGQTNKGELTAVKAKKAAIWSNELSEASESCQVSKGVQQGSPEVAMVGDVRNARASACCFGMSRFCTHLPFSQTNQLDPFPTCSYWYKGRFLLLARGHVLTPMKVTRVSRP